MKASHSYRVELISRVSQPRIRSASTYVVVQVRRVGDDRVLRLVSDAERLLRLLLRVVHASEDSPGVARPRELLVGPADELLAVEGGLADRGAQLAGELRGGKRALRKLNGRLRLAQDLRELDEGIQAEDEDALEAG